MYNPLKAPHNYISTHYILMSIHPLAVRNFLIFLFKPWSYPTILLHKLFSSWLFIEYFSLDFKEITIIMEIDTKFSSSSNLLILITDLYINQKPLYPPTSFWLYVIDRNVFVCMTFNILQPLLKRYLHYHITLMSLERFHWFIYTNLKSFEWH